jgi:uncharacterized BrkB/YihY/UPF0761 family membrane protein
LTDRLHKAAQRYLGDRLIGPAAQHVLRHPGAFLLQTLKGFKANQGLLLAGAVAYYALLSIVPLLILTVIALSQLIDQRELLATIGRYLEWLVPSQSRPIVNELANFLEKRQGVGWLLLATMVFFSSLAFTVLENAMSVIFLHRVVARKRRFIFSVLIPYAYILSLGAGLCSSRSSPAACRRSARRTSSCSAGVVAERVLRAAALPARLRRRGLRPHLGLSRHAGGRLAWRHALIGGITAAVLWEITRHVLVWYFATLSQVNVVYGSLTTAIVVLLSLELAATLLLFGAQVISEYERIGRSPVIEAEPGFTTAAV